MVTDKSDKIVTARSNSTPFDHPFDYLFSPRNVTIVGVSRNPNFGSGFFISALRHSGYPPDQIFLINPKYAGETFKSKNYILPIMGSINDLPDNLDLVISAIRAKLVPQLMRDCVKKQVKFVLVFSSGFSETSSEVGMQLERELKEIIKGSQTRIIGPNCLGPLNPESRVTFNPKASMRLGSISFASQSGGHATSLAEIQDSRLLYFRKGLSFGNQIDVNCLEVLDYYARDPLNKVIGLYLEDLGTANGRDFIIKLREVTKKIPVIIWKGGQTQQGMRASQSHTGALAGSIRLWESAIRQAGGIFVRTVSEFWDLLHLFSTIETKRFPKGNRIGLLVPGGGNSVELTDTFSRYGFDVPELSPETQAKIGDLYPDVNTSFRNPIDTGASGTLPDLLFKTVRILDADPLIDLIALFLPISWVAQLERMGVSKYVASLARSFGRLNKKLSKLFVQITPMIEYSEFTTRVTLEYKQVVQKKQIPFFDTKIDAAVACRHLLDYVEYLQKSA